MMNLRFAVWIFLIGVMVLGAGVVSGQNFPNRPIRMVMGTAGGGSDFVARILVQGISGPLGQPVIVENRTSITAAEIVSKASPDGYSLLVGGGSFLAFPLLRKASFDVVRDFSPISLLVREINVLAVHPSLPVKSVKELIALAKASPGKLNYSSTGPGGPSHIGGELFKSMAGVNIVWVPYKGTSAAIVALLSNEVQMSIVDAGNAATHVKSGRLRALAVTSAQPSALFPALPTVAASGVPGYESVGIAGILAPARTPAAIINRLNFEMVRVITREDVKEQLFNRETEVVGSTPAEYLAIIKSDIAKLGKVIKDAGIKVN